MDISCISSHVWLLLTSSSHMLMTILYIIDHYILNQSILMAFLKPSGKSCAAKSLLFILVLHDNLFFSLPSTSYPTYTLLGRKENSSFPFLLMEKTYFPSVSRSFHCILLRLSIHGLSNPCSENMDLHGRRTWYKG